MKRLIIVASLAIAAIGCQKTEVQNVVNNEIGFNVETAKMTRAIVQNDENNPTANVTYPESQPFGVYSYATQGGQSLGGVMNNVEISKVEGAWKNARTPYYWPNETNTLLSFYAYSPYNANMTHSVAGGFAFTYTHVQDCDFMVAKTLDQTYASNSGVVGLTFAHELTQIQFVVKPSALTGVTYEVQSITLNNIVKKADYVQIPTSSAVQWTPANEGGYYGVGAEGCELTVNGEEGAQSTTPATMIPQDLTNATFTVVYEIHGTGAANETVTRTLPLAYSVGSESVDEWVANKKITYNLTMTLKEITFAPVVAPWENVTANDIDIKPADTPAN